MYQNGAEQHNESQYPIELINTLLRDMMVKLKRIATALSNLHPPNDKLIQRIRDLASSNYTKNGHTAKQMYDIIKDILKNKKIMHTVSSGLTSTGAASTLDEHSLRTMNDKFMTKYNSYYDMIREYKSELPQAKALHFNNEIVGRLPISVGVLATGNNEQINMAHAIQAESRLFNAPHIPPTINYYPIFKSRSRSRAKSMNKQKHKSKSKSIGRHKSI